MTHFLRQRLALALSFSLLLHLGVLVTPGWYLPTTDETLSPESSSLLETRLAPPPGSRSADPSSYSRPPPRKPRHSAAPLPAPVSEEAPQIEPPPALPSSSAEAPPSNSVSALPLSSAEPATDAVATAVPAELAAPADPPSNTSKPVPEPSLPRQGSIRFAISRGDQGFVIGQSLHRWSHDGKHYTLSSVTETTGIAALFKPARVLQSSEGEIDVAGLRPSEFRTEKNGIAGDTASFDWSAMTLLLSAGSQREVPLVSGAQDMLSMFYQLGAVFPWVPHELKEIMVATGRKFEHYSFEVVREELLPTKYGETRTLHLRSTAGVEAIDIWAGLDLLGLPLKIRYTDRQGELFDQNAEEIEIDGTPVSTRNQ